ncbi:unnamed protein product [Phytophthora fragariaefolia]|uniref:Unnamed protein product n=1 Tax=Phytophthora fragariaefolia TaxID=1490495 RepID=A0A9W7CPF0_9STRA|nr:unnamed protein product [Phytophthora fragariaefolia]
MAGLGMSQYHPATNCLHEVASQFKKGDFSHCDRTRRADRATLTSDKHMSEHHEPLPPQLSQTGETGTLTGELGTLSGDLSGATQLPTQATEMRSVTGELSMMADMPSQTTEMWSGSVELRETAEVQTNVESEE